MRDRYTLADRLDARSGLRTGRMGHVRGGEMGGSRRRATYFVFVTARLAASRAWCPIRTNHLRLHFLLIVLGRRRCNFGQWPASMGARETSAVVASIFLVSAREDGLGACAGSENEYIPPCFPRLPRRLPPPFSRPFPLPRPPTPRPHHLLHADNPETEVTISPSHRPHSRCRTRPKP